MNDDNEIYEGQVREPTVEVQAMETRQKEALDWEAPTAATREAVEYEALPWLKAEEIDELQSRWNSIQIEFVDDPRSSVKQADALVAEALERIEQAFSTQRTVLDEQWNKQADASTEDLRIAMQSYRSFLNRLLAL